MSVPIIGQPTIRAFSVTLIIDCACKAPLLFQGLPGAAIKCIACGNCYELARFPQVDPSGSGLLVELRPFCDVPELPK